MTYPRNKDFYLKLIALGQECLKICEGLNIHPIIHGSVAYMFYTKDNDIEVHDLDLLIPESVMGILAAELAKHNIAHKLTDHPTIKVIKDEAIVSFHSLEYFTNNLPRSSITVDIEGSKFQVLNLEALKKGYEISIKLEPERTDKYSKRLIKLKQIASS